MGRHAAAVGADVDPVVAAALARRGSVGAAPRHTDDGDRRRATPVGWPGRGDEEAPGGSPVGWPGSAPEEPAPELPAVAPAPAPERTRGWRRLLGGGRAA